VEESRGPNRSKRVTPNVERIELPLLRTKLYAPRLPAGLISRPGQMLLLDQALRHKVTLVSTPPGYGKSTLVSQWVESSRYPSAWISLDEADNDSTSFFRYLLAAIDSIDDGLTVATRRLLRDHRGMPARAIVDSLVSDLASATRPFVLVFDDFHVIEAPELLEGVARLMTYAPPSLRLVIVSRSDPRLPLMRKRAQGELFELRASDLAFTPEETRELLCDRYTLPITESQLAVLQAWSEGWPLGLMLLGQALQEQAPEQISAIIDRFAANPDFIADYLWRELIERQPEDRKQFLLRSSILEQFNVQLCNTVTGGTDAELQLVAVAEENLFLIPLGERRSWYRYHHLFQDVLRERLDHALPKNEILALHSRAAHWYRSEGLVEEAAAHAIQSQDWDLALDILAPLCGELFRQERLSSVRTWLDALPDDVVMRNPQLSSEFAWSLIRVGQAARSRMFTNAAEAAWTALGDNVGIGRIAVLRALDDFYLQNSAQGVERCQQGLALLPNDYAEDRARAFAVLGNIYTQTGDLAAAEEALVHCRLLARETGSLSLQLVEMNASAICLLTRGELGEAETLLQRVIANGDEWNDLPVVYAHVLLGGLYLDQYRFDLAEQVIERALELADRLSARIHQIRIYRLLAELAWARREFETAFVEVERSIGAGSPVGFGMEVRASRALLAHFWIRQGKFNLARAWTAELDLDVDQPPRFAYVDEYLFAVELLGRDGQARRALASLDRSIAQAEANGHRHNLLHMLLLKSILLTSQGMGKESNAALGAAIEIAVRAGYVRPFLAFGAELEDQLHELYKTSAHARFIRHLLELMRRDRQHSESPEDMENPLSKRQTEIMQLVAAGYSNRDIADQLFISEQTVKKHLGTAFVRLDVSSRTQAIDVCRRLNIL
jgi:LuxR family maltose regulon positive regulatory protein